jgi:hypothetical protein
MSEIISFHAKKNEGLTFYVTLADPNDAEARVTNPTIVAGDVTYSTDGGAFANLGTTPTVAPAGGIGVLVTVAQAEMNGDNILIHFQDLTGAAQWSPLTVSIHTYAVDVDDLVRSTTPANALTVVATGQCGLNFDDVNAATAPTTLTNITVPVVSTLTGHTVQTGDSYARLAAPAGASISADIAALKVDTAAILVDTNELQTDWVNGGRLDLLLDAVLADTNMLQTDWVNGGRLDLIIDAILSDTNAILVDTNELQGDWTNTGRLDTILDAVLADTDELQTDWKNTGRLDTILDSILDDTGTSGVKIDHAQAYTEGQSVRTTGGALECAEAAQRNRLIDPGVGGQRILYRSDKSTKLAERTHNTTELTPP